MQSFMVNPFDGITEYMGRQWGNNFLAILLKRDALAVSDTVSGPDYEYTVSGSLWVKWALL